MKNRMIGVISGIFLVLALMIPCLSSAADISDIQQDIAGQVNGILADSDIDKDFSELSALSPSTILETVRNSLASELEIPVRLLGILLMIVVLSAIFNSLSENSTGGLTELISTMTAVTLILPQIYQVFSTSMEAAGRLGGFMLVFVPAFAGLTTVCGGLTAAGAYDVLILSCSEFVIALSDSVLMPVLGIISALGISGSAFRSKPSESLAQILRKMIVWGMTVVMTLFTGLVSLKCSIAGKADTALSKTARFVLSGAVPVVGSAVSDAYSSVRGSFEVIRCSVGAVGIGAALLILLPPVIKLLIFRFVLWLGAGSAEIFSSTPLAGLLRSFDAGLAIVQSLLICYGMMFIISSAILIQSVN